MRGPAGARHGLDWRPVKWRPEPSDRFYRFIVRTGLALRWLFRIRVLVTGREHLPQPGPPNASTRGASTRLPSRPVVPGQGAVVAITHFGYLDFAFAEMLLWWHNRAQLRFLITQGAADHWFAGPAVSAAGHVVVGYGSGAHAYDAAVARLREGEYVAVLPEAGVSRSFTVRECKTGAVRMAAEAGVPGPRRRAWPRPCRTGSTTALPISPCDRPPGPGGCRPVLAAAPRPRRKDAGSTRPTAPGAQVPSADKPYFRHRLD